MTLSEACEAARPVIFCDPVESRVIPHRFRRYRFEGRLPELPWMVLASQEAREVTGPVHNMTAFALLVMILALLILSLLAAYVFLHRKQELGRY